MQTISNQLTLGLSLRDEATFDNFYSATNAEVIVELKKTVSGQGEKQIYLCGTRGQGLSHLLQAACHHAHQQQKTSVYLPLAQLVSLTPEMLNGLELLDLVCIDDLHVIAGRAEWEEAIFHLYNRLHDAGKNMIIAANDLPKAIHLQLPDLVSRLSWGVIFQLHPLADAEKLSILTLRANRRGITLSDEVGKYILTHCPRHMGTLFAALDALDKASLAAQRRLTIPFVKEVLEI
jgi:DnaA family protein